jgi:hypothetical protein
VNRRDTIEELRKRVAECEEARNDDRAQEMARISAAANDRAVRDFGWNPMNRLAHEPGDGCDGRLSARVCVLAVVLMLEDRADALLVTTFGDVKAGFVEQARIDRLRQLLGEVTEEEQAAAIALWDETAT